MGIVACVCLMSRHVGCRTAKWKPRADRCTVCPTGRSNVHTHTWARIDVRLSRATAVGGWLYKLECSGITKRLSSRSSSRIHTTVPTGRLLTDLLAFPGPPFFPVPRLGGSKTHGGVTKPFSLLHDTSIYNYYSPTLRPHRPTNLHLYLQLHR